MSQACPQCRFDLADHVPGQPCPRCGSATDFKTAEKTDAFHDQATLGRPSASFAGERPAGTRAFGDYEILGEIARGGMGVVYKARQKSLDRVVALKMILQGAFAGPADVERFAIEAQAAAKLDHSGIVPIYDFGQIDGQHFFSMALVEGEGLADRIEKAGCLSDLETAELIRSVAQAITYAHQQGVIHRDLKPANILLDRQGQPRVTDFGLAKQLGEQSQLTVTGQTLGTPSYMPPEQAGKTDAEVGPASDVYSLGAILYTALTGNPPFQGETLLEVLTQVMQHDPVPPTQLNPKIPADLETICLKCLEKDPRQRYQTAEELEAELSRFLNGEPITARPLSMIGTLLRWRRMIERNPDVRISSSTRLCGLPVVDIAFGRDNAKGETSGHAKGIIALGDKATGVIAFGGVARGVFAWGKYSVGVASGGLCTAGLLGIGFISIGVFATGALAVGYGAFGFCAIGYHAIGLIAVGVTAFGSFRLPLAQLWQSAAGCLPRFWKPY